MRVNNQHRRNNFGSSALAYHEIGQELRFIDGAVAVGVQMAECLPVALFVPVAIWMQCPANVGLGLGWMICGIGVREGRVSRSFHVGDGALLTKN